jgi:hypothetical protein
MRRLLPYRIIDVLRFGERPKLSRISPTLLKEVANRPVAEIGLRNV